MSSQEFPSFVKNLPEADLPFEGLSGWLFQGDDGLVVFLEADVEVKVSEHSHGNQWGIVTGGEMQLRIGDTEKTYRAGDSYFIPAGTPHQAVLYKGFRAVDYFADKGRYRPRVK